VSTLPLFPVTTVGSWPRPPELLALQAQHQRGRATAGDLERAADEAVLEVIRRQEAAGVDIVTDGEQRRDNFYSFVADKTEGVRLMTLAEMLDVVDDKASFERILQTLDVPAFSIRNPTCVGRIARRRPLAQDEYRFLRSHTDRAIKIPLPGPYLLTRAMWVPEVTRDVYESKQELGDDVVQILRDEIAELRDAGVDFVQLDEPVLTELVFTQGQTRTVMCATLAARSDPAEELEWAVELINRVVEGFEDLRLGVHVCRGNWSRREDILLRGSYHPLAPYLARLDVRQLVLEFATSRAGDLGALFDAAPIADGKELGLGVVNPRSEEVESVDDIVARVEELRGWLPADRIFLNPDCGFGTFASRPLNTAEVIGRKLSAMVDAAGRLRAASADVASAAPGSRVGT
jgi:5-methyltetrahydropteroyltriglutamate--homocysteine methyltransferase